MARFSDSWLTELLNKNDIVEVVSQYVTLKENGGRYWGLCPFHGEKTPSFSVSRDRQLFYCFGCKEGGNVIHFIMKMEKLPFYEAVEFLANRVSLAMPEIEEDTAYEEKKRLADKITSMNKDAALFYHKLLLSGEGRQALEYLKNRGIELSTVKRFGLGYSPDAWDALYNHLKGKGYSASDMKAAWLIKVKENGAYDMFRNRIMFPIINAFSRVIAFGGRVMDASTPKYLNSSDTPVFNKRKNLYALNILKEEKQLKYAVLVEGYMDAISLSAAGVKGAVASLGTSLTAEQAQLLKRYTPNVYISYDGDFAGETAALKAAGILEKAGLNAKVIRYEDGMDPDDFIRKYGLKGFAEKQKAARSVYDFKLDMKKRDFDLSDEDGRMNYATEGLKILADLKSPVQKERYVARLNKETGFSVESLNAQAGTEENSFVNYRYNSIKSTAKEPASEKKAENLLIFNVLNLPQLVLAAEKELAEDDFSDAVYKKIFYLIFDRVKKGILPACAEILSLLKEPDEIKKVNELLQGDFDEKNSEKIVEDCIMKMKILSLEKKRQSLMERILKAEEPEKKQLLKELSVIDKNLYEKRSRPF